MTVCPAHAGIDLRLGTPLAYQVYLPRTRGDRPIDEAHGETRTVIVSKAPFTPHWVTLVFSGNVWSEPFDGMRLITAYQDRTLEKSRGKPWLTIPEDSK